MFAAWMLATAVVWFTGEAPAITQKEKGKEIKEVNLEGYGLKFTVPAGWKVTKLEKDTDGTWTCILQEQAARGKIKPTIGIWAGAKFLKNRRTASI